MILLLAGVAGNLAWITIAAEEAPDLIGGAPVDREKVRWLKAAAALWPIAFIAAPFIVFYLVRAPRLGLAIGPVFLHEPRVKVERAISGSDRSKTWGSISRSSSARSRSPPPAI